jgi:flagellar basal-body rod protein FlgB
MVALEEQALRPLDHLRAGLGVHLEDAVVVLLRVHVVWPSGRQELARCLLLRAATALAAPIGRTARTPTMQNALFDSTVHLLQTAMSYGMRRHEVIASNMANVETPNYKAKDLPFTAILKAAMNRAEATPTAYPRFQQPRIVFDVTGEVRSDGNNVNAENEMMKLVKNSGMFVAAVELIRFKFTSLRTAMSSAQ